MCITISAQSVSLGWLQFGPGVMENIFKSVGGKSGLEVRGRYPLGRPPGQGIQGGSWM